MAGTVLRVADSWWVDTVAGLVPGILNLECLIFPSSLDMRTISSYAEATSLQNSGKSECMKFLGATCRHFLSLESF